MALSGTESKSLSAKIAAIATANATLTSGGLPRYDDLVELLRAAENKFAGMQSYHSGSSAQSIEAFRTKINDALSGYPYP